MSVRRDDKTNRWAFRFTATKDGRKQQLYGTPGKVGSPYEHLTNTKEGAKEAERMAREELRRPTVVHATVPTFEAFTEEVYMDKMETVGNKKGKNKRSVLDTKRSHLRTHLYPRFGATRLDRIDAVAIEDFKIALHKRGLAPKSINNVVSTLHNVLANAVRRGHLQALPAIEWQRVPQQAFDFLTFEEAERLLVAAAADSWLGCAIVLALKTGMRLGELRALRRVDLDLAKGQVTVCRSLWKKDHEGTPKNGRTRVIDLPESARRALKAHRHLRGERVFLDPDGHDYTIAKWRTALYQACARAGLRKIGWHALRHTYASHMVMRGATLKVVAELMGHSTITMTNRYAHLAEGATRAAVATLDAPAPTWTCSTAAVSDVTA